MKQLHSRCRKGLHDLTAPGAVRVETVRQQGRVYEARRCKACQHDRYRALNSHRSERKHPQDRAAGTGRFVATGAPRGDVL